MILSKLRLFFRLTRPTNVFTNVHVMVGFFVGKHGQLGSADISLISVSYLLMVILYGGIYTINDLFDLENDRKHPDKRFTRPIASGKVTVQEAKILAFSSHTYIAKYAWNIS